MPFTSHTHSENITSLSLWSCHCHCGGLLWARRFLGLLMVVAPLRSSLGSCPLPSNPRGAKPKDFTGITEFPVGSIVTYECDRGFRLVPGTDNYIICGQNSEWSQPQEFCKESCPSPPNVPGAILRSQYTMISYFPIGAVVVYNCRSGFAHVPNTQRSVNCTAGFRWSRPVRFCQESCSAPPSFRFVRLQAEYRNLYFFPSGARVRYDCNFGYERLPGVDDSIECGDNYRWSHVLLFCKGLCPPPPTLPGAKLKSVYVSLLEYVVDTQVEYDCETGYAHDPTSRKFITCQDNLRWSDPGKLCESVCPIPPNVTGAKLQRRFVGLIYFPVRTVVRYDCVGQYRHVPHTKNSITCGNNLRWSTPEVFCKVSCPLPPSLMNAKLKEQFERLEYFPVGSVVEYACKQGYKQVPHTKNSVRCGVDLQWPQLEEFCQVSCDFPPNLRGAKLISEDSGYYPAGTVLMYECDRGYKYIHGTDTSLRCSDRFTWSQPDEFCKAMECDDPVVEHGVKVTGIGRIHLYGNNIAFECNIGYFMIGSYLIQCEENNTWSPKVPSCKKINAKLCGAPLVPSGIVHPLEPEYDLGTYIFILCNPQYSFPDETMEMTTVCQGHNLWKPPAQPCMFRTSLDTSTLIIHNGRIVHGKKEKYKPGDNITIECYAGYILQGTSVVRYIGGKKWSPGIPYCSLSFFFILLIIALIFFILLVLAKTYKEYIQKKEDLNTQACCQNTPEIKGRNSSSPGNSLGQQGLQALHAHHQNNASEHCCQALLPSVAAKRRHRASLPSIDTMHEEMQELGTQVSPRGPSNVSTVVSCGNPVVEHGTPISELTHTHALGSTVSFECMIGYYMVGSYWIRCNADSLWIPGVPSCIPIASNSCGAPLIPSASVSPLANEYTVGKEVRILCNPQKCFPDETIEMSTVCQGYNSWDPPVQPCFLRTSPDTVKLKILNGRIIGKKKTYIPGDNITVHCYAGYSLRGSPAIRYIGGKKWFPEIPSCNLSFFFVLLILAIAFIILLLPVKILYDKVFYRHQNVSTN
ncbi:complement receptor type 2-like [Paroedura picta]|uniref:complement receptor type 2-like n=1 Tax=Paroedura picta TaxID=143630 RepID=UPI004057B4D3